MRGPRHNSIVGIGSSARLSYRIRIRISTRNDPASGAVDGRGRHRHLGHHSGPAAVNLAVESHHSSHLPEAPNYPASSITGRGATENGNRNLLPRWLSVRQSKGTGRPFALAQTSGNATRPPDDPDGSDVDMYAVSEQSVAVVRPTGGRISRPKGAHR